MYYFAFALLLAALLGSLAFAGAALIHLWQKKDGIPAFIERGHILVTGCFLMASAFLLHALYWKDYRLDYVASYTDNILPLFYRLTAFWAGQPGSMLFWGLTVAVMGSVFALTRNYKSLSGETKLWFWTFFYILIAFFGLIMTVWSNPFAMQYPVPADGRGLNPLLQNPGMIIHPPLLFLGYAGFAIPTCLALAGALSREQESERPWYVSTRAFMLLAWAFLSAGILLGAWWAYMELGWGGYWAWDPVENSSLIPWLFATATFHTVVVERRRQILRRTNIFLISLTTLSSFFATYLVRSGVIDSVHAFGQGPVGRPLLIFILAALALITAVSWQAKPHGNRFSDPASREGLLVLASWILIAVGFIIATATMWPVISRLWTASPQGLDASFYNRVCLPLGTVLIALAAFCPLLGWSGKISRAQALVTLCAALIAAGVIWALGYRQTLPLVTSAFAAAAAVALLWMAGSRLAGKGAGFTPAAIGIHIGVILIALGVSFSGPYKMEEELTFTANGSAKLGAYTITMKKLSQGEEPGYEYLEPALEVQKNGKVLGTLRPQKRAYDKFQGMLFTEVDVIPSLGEEVYASVSGMDSRENVICKVSIEPGVNWLWIGGAVMSILPLLALRRRKRMPHDPD